MKIPLLTISVLTAIIINPVSHIGIFLDLRDQISFTNCMNGTRLDKKHIPFMNFNLVQNFQKGLILNSLLKLRLGNFTGKSIIQAGTFLAVHDIPHLRLAILTFILHGILIIRMYLDRPFATWLGPSGWQESSQVSASLSPSYSFPNSVISLVPPHR